MDILSFVLGIAVVVVIGITIVAVMAFFKVNYLTKELNHTNNQLHTEIDNLQRRITIETEQTRSEIYREFEGVNRRIDENVNEIFRTIDSRFDKFETRVTSRKA